MKRILVVKWTVLILLSVIGAVIGYFIGTKGGLSGQWLFDEIYWGIFLFYSVTLAVLEREDEATVLIGAIIGFLVAIFLDWIAHSPIDMRNKLSYMALCAFVAWGYKWGGKVYWKSVLIGGIIVGSFGFALGLFRNQQFGEIVLTPGLFNAGLTFVHYYIVGMAVGSLYLKSIGWRFVK